MGYAKRNLYRKKFEKSYAQLLLLLDRIGFPELLQLVWGAQAFHSNETHLASRIIQLPTGMFDWEIKKQYPIYKWDIETLLNLKISRTGFEEKGIPLLNDQSLSLQKLHLLTIHLHHTEDREFVIRTEASDILYEMDRIIHRQIPWQRGFVTTEKFYRYSFVYGRQNCAAHFQKKYGIELVDFTKIAFLLYCILKQQPWSRLVCQCSYGIEEWQWSRVIQILSRPLLSLPQELDALQNAEKSRLAYSPSVLRQFPIISIPEEGNFTAPLPDLIISRITAGLFYEICADTALINEANSNFEEYVRTVIPSYLPQLETLKPERYGPKKSQRDPPDIFVKHQNKVVAVIECKATKLSFNAQFAGNRSDDLTDLSEQVVKGILQLWKLFSDVRTGKFKHHQISCDTPAILLTLDPWFQNSAHKRRRAIKLAADVAMGDPDIEEIDQRPIVFCSMQELVDLMAISNTPFFLEVLKDACSPDCDGKGVDYIGRQKGSDRRNKFSLNMQSVLPWWDMVGNKR